MSKLLACLTLVLCVGGCIPPAQSPAPAALYAIPITLFVVRLTESFGVPRLTSLIASATDIFRKHNLRLEYRGMRDHFANPDWSNVSESNIAHLQRYAREIKQPKATFAVDTVSWDGIQRGGLGYRNGISIIGRVSCPTVIAHELAHVHGLPHQETPFNLMHPKGCTLTDTTLDDPQLSIIKSSLKDPATARTSDTPFVC